MDLLAAFPQRFSGFQQSQQRINIEETTVPPSDKSSTTHRKGEGAPFLAQHSPTLSFPAPDFQIIFLLTRSSLFNATVVFSEPKATVTCLPCISSTIPIADCPFNRTLSPFSTTTLSA